MGALALAGYVVTIGVATYQVSLEDLTPYQINLLMGVAMLAVSLPAVLLTEGSVQVARRHLPLGTLVAFLMAAGSLFYAIALSRRPAGVTAAIATSYVVLVVVLSVIFLRETLDWVIALGVMLTVAGVAILSFRA